MVNSYTNTYFRTAGSVGRRVQYRMPTSVIRDYRLEFVSTSHPQIDQTRKPFASDFAQPGERLAQSILRPTGKNFESILAFLEESDTGISTSRLRMLREELAVLTENSQKVMKTFQSSLNLFIEFCISLPAKSNLDFVLTDEGTVQAYWIASKEKLIINFSPVFELAYLGAESKDPRSILSLSGDITELPDFVLNTKLLSKFFK